MADFFLHEKRLVLIMWKTMSAVLVGEESIVPQDIPTMEVGKMGFFYNPEKRWRGWCSCSGGVELQSSAEDSPVVFLVDIMEAFVPENMYLPVDTVFCSFICLGSRVEIITGKGVCTSSIKS